MSWCFSKWHWWSLSVHSEQLTRATTLPRYGTGPSLKFVCFNAGSLVLYKGLWYLGKHGARTPESGLSPRMGQYISRHIPSRRKTLGFSAVAPELRSGGGTAGACRGGRLHRVDTRNKVDGWKTLIDYLNPAYLCMTVHGGNPADLSNGVGKVYNLCRV
jgi:hypothetical protein